MGNKSYSGLPKGVKRVNADLSNYRVFASKARDSHSYYDDDGETADWFKKNSNIDKVIDDMTDRERYIINRFWATGHFMGGQQYLGFSNMSTTDQMLTRTIDEIIDRSVINKDCTVVRLSDWNQLGGPKSPAELDALIGKETPVIGHQSAAAAAEGLTIGSFSKQVEYKFHIPAGTKGAAMWIGDTRINDWGYEQREVVINRDTVWKITGHSTYKNSDGTTITVINLEFSRKLQHDYN
jgi:hypothetical protein